MKTMNIAVLGVGDLVVVSAEIHDDRRLFYNPPVLVGQLHGLRMPAAVSR